MIQQEKFQGLLTAIEAESKSPSPSHQNLARLVTMVFRELLRSIDDMSFKTTYIHQPTVSVLTSTDLNSNSTSSTPTNVEWTEPTTTLNHADTEPEEPKKKRKKHK